MNHPDKTNINTPDIENVNVTDFDPMPSPEEMHAWLPLSENATRTVMHGRESVRNILDRKDNRLLVIVGPCSIHDPIAGMDYARRLKKLADDVGDTLCIVMRVYFEKPRTTTGWKGYINDPDLDDSFHVDEGMKKAREFLLKIAELGLPAGTEALDPISPQYLGDLISWTAIGARTTESQTHREISSGLSTPVGFKNGTNGDVAIAINAIVSASRPHSFLGINGQGRTSIVRTRGNRYGHLVLRGGRREQNEAIVAERPRKRTDLGLDHGKCLRVLDSEGPLEGLLRYDGSGHPASTSLSSAAAASAESPIRLVWCRIVCLLSCR